MTTGAYISGIAHIALLVILLFGGLFSRSRAPEITVADVSVISEAEFAALMRPDAAPSVSSETSDPEQPVPAEAAPVIAALPDTPPETADPARPEAPQPNDTPADPLPAPAPAPEAEVTDVLPPVDAPPVPDDRPDAPEETTPQPAPRVAPEPAAPSEPLIEAAPEVVTETAPQESPETPAPEQEAAAPEEATTEIVTEAERPSLAPSAAPRPRARPERSQVAETQPEQPAANPVADAVADAVASAAPPQEAPPSPAPAPSGPPLTRGEKDALRVSVQQCWNVGSLSSDALRSTVTVSVSMAQDGRPDAGSIRMIGFEGGTEAGARQAYEAARRAIIRCGASGYDLPIDKYAQWRNIEMTFNPEGMRLK